MRNTRESSSTGPSARTTPTNHPTSAAPRTTGGSGPSTTAGSNAAAGGCAQDAVNAFSAAFLDHAALREDVHLAGPAIASGLVGGSFWHGPWEVEPVKMQHGNVWAVVRRGESVRTGGPPAAVTWYRSDALLIAATLPGLAVPSSLRHGEKAKKLGFPIHHGRRCIGHLARPEPRILDHLHMARTLVGRPESFALAVEALGREEVPALGRALMRRIAAEHSGSTAGRPD